MLSISDVINAQGIVGKIQKVKNGIENASRNVKKDTEKRKEKEERTNPKSVDKSDFHSQNIGKVLFVKGPRSSVVEGEERSQEVLDLNSPSYLNIYLEDPLYNILAKQNKIGEYDVVSPGLTRRYYINNELICKYSENMDMDDFKTKVLLSEVFVPEDEMTFKENEFKVGVMAHVLSSLMDGTHTLKVDYVINISKEVPSSPGSAAISYENHEHLVASGEVKVNINKSDLNRYCKLYGRPKFSKGVLQSEAQLERTITDMIKADSKRTPIYMYGNDNWTILRGAFDRIVGREVRVYYVFINDKGRAELSDCVIRQDYDGRNYINAKFGLSRNAPAFKYVCKQNY